MLSGNLMVVPRLGYRRIESTDVADDAVRIGWQNARLLFLKLHNGLDSSEKFVKKRSLVSFRRFFSLFSL